MSRGEIVWESLLHSDAPAACALKRALFTTYDRADERLLVEHALPLFLKLSREPDGEGSERKYFLLELDRRLKQLHDKLMIVSSTVREEPASDEEVSGAYGWIWRSIRHLTVGNRGKAVQHAKLWLLHWGAEEPGGSEYLEIVVSSANLTMPAFKGQMQAAWRACLELSSQRSEARLTRWGVLPDFLLQMAASAGDAARFQPFLELLAHCERPDGSVFVASVPGTHPSRGTRWGAAGLRAIAPQGRGTVSVSILCPYVGSWGAETLTHWCSAFEGSPRRLELLWIGKDHPWAHARRWTLPKATLKVLVGLDCSIVELRQEPDDPDDSDLFHAEHRPADGRWSHSKVYSFRRGKARRLLVTSANFSPSAWGRQRKPGEISIENFELGVCVEQAEWPFDHLIPFSDMKDVATVSAPPAIAATVIVWAGAAWNGKTVEVECRCDPGRELEGVVECAGDPKPIAAWRADRDRWLRSGRVSWTDAKTPPVTVRLTCDDETVIVAVFDERPSREREHSAPPEVDEDGLQEAKDEMLFEQYGGRVASEDDDERPRDDDKGDSRDDAETPAGDSADGDGPANDSDVDEDTEEEGAGRAESYAVPTFVLARRYLAVVDCWADRVRRAGTSAAASFELELFRRDGELLCEAFSRQATRDEKKGTTRAIGARLAREEISVRLKHFPEM